MAVRIKLCGITSLEDAMAARDAGADYLGFILFPGSPRYISPEKVIEIAGSLKSAENCPLLVGVFVDEPVENVASILDACGLDLAQLSGDEPPAFLTHSTSLVYGRVYKSIQPKTEVEAFIEAVKYRPPSPHPGQPHLLLDAYHETLRGGTGLTADWSMAAAVNKKHPGLMLAGGLNPDNVRQAIKEVQPFAVDVSSGVEDSPGIKNLEKIQDFVRAVRSA